MQEHLNSMKEQVKTRITFLINNNKLKEADELLIEYFQIVEDDIDAYSMKAVILIINEEFDEADKILKIALNIDNSDFDINYNLGYLNEKVKKFSEAVYYYDKALKSCNKQKIREEIKRNIDNIKDTHEVITYKEREKLVFFIKQGFDGFIDDVINELSIEYETKKVIITKLEQIDEWMKWGDICWFEWCDELIAYGSKYILAASKKIICRLHSYEVFTDFPLQVKWNNLNKVIFVAEHIRNFAIERFNIDVVKTLVIPNGVNLAKYTFKERTKGFNIAYVGYINYKKGPMLLLHTFKAIYDNDNRYKLYIAGIFQDARDELYFKQMIKEFGIENSVFYDGWQSNLDLWLEDKNYILCTSLLESQNMSVMQAMAKGIKPIVHNFVGAKTIYPHNYLWNTLNDAVDIIESYKYDSNEYKEFIKKNYDLEITNGKIRDQLKFLLEYQNEEPLVSVVMTVYDREKYVGEAIDSVLGQSYKNIELIIVNDGSIDNSENIIKNYQDKRIIYFYKKNTGQLDTLRFGLEKANGKYVTRVDSDDKIDTDYIKICLKEIQKKDLDFVYTDFILINDESKKIGEINNINYEEPKKILQDILVKFSSVIPDVAFWKKEYTNNVIINYTHENVPYYIDNILQCKFSHINKKLYYYRQHNANFAQNEENLKFVISGKIKFINLLIRKYFIQMDINKDYSKNESNYLIYFINIYLNQANYFKGINIEIYKMFLNEVYYWIDMLKETECNKESIIELEDKIASIKIEKQDSYKHRNKRILIVSTDNPNNGQSIGGKHIHIHLLQKALNERDIVNYLVTYMPVERCNINISQMIEDLGIENFQDDEDRNFMYLIYIMQKQLEASIEKLILSSYISYISCQDVVSTIATYNVLKKVNMKIPIITTLHGYFTDENVDYGGLKMNSFIYNYFKKIYESKAYKISDKIIAVDTRIKDYVDSIIGSNDKITVIKNAINDIDFNVGFDDFTSFNENILFVPRRLVPKNGVIYAAKAVHELIKRGINNFKLLIAGDGNEKLEIESYISTNKLEKNIYLLGGIYHNNIIQYFKKSKVVIIPSISSNNVEEATSLAALEGMACGKIVVASSVGGLKEIIKDGFNGYLFEPKNEKMLADVLEILIKIDKKSYNIIAKNARKEIELNHGYINHANACLKVFDETL